MVLTVAADNAVGTAGARAGSVQAARTQSTRRALFGWAALGVGALAIAGVFAFLLAVSRIPGSEGVIPWPLGFFHKALVIHVTFSFVIWFLAVFGALAVLARRALADQAVVGAGRTEHGGGVPGAAATIGIAAAALALPLLFVPAFLDRGEATLNNYVPAIIDPLYYAGLALLALAVAAPVLSLIGAVARAGRPALVQPLPLALSVASVIYVLALVCFASALTIQRQDPLTFAFNEQLFWGGGHVLQILNTLLLLVAWSWLGARAADRPVVSRPAFVAAAGILLALALIAPVFYVLFPPFSAEQTRAFTVLQYGFGPAVAIVAGALAFGLPRPWPWKRTELSCLALSLALFTVGGALGLFVDGADTRTPAHYHGVIAAVTLAFMGLFYSVFLPVLGRRGPSGRAIRIQLHLFAWGQLAACVGLFIAGGHGAPRKVAGEAQGLHDIAAEIGMGLNGIGGLIAIVGGILFVWLVARALLRHETDAPQTVMSRLWR
jgi:cytochrome c oxidase subunit 1